MYSVAFQGIGNCEAATLSGKVTTRPPTVAWFLWIQTFLSCSKQNAWHTNLVVNDMQLTTALLTSEGFPQGEWFDYHQRRKYFCLINVTCLSIIYWTLILWLVPREKLNSPRRKTFHVYQFMKVHLSEWPSLAKTRAPTHSDVRDFVKLLA